MGKMKLTIQLPADANEYNTFCDGPVFKVTHPNDIKIVEMLMNQS